jgi:hypothetical protein
MVVKRIRWPRWQAAGLARQETADSRTVADYSVLADGVLIAQMPNTYIELTGLTPGKTYSFTVEAINTAIAASSPSNVVSGALLASVPA